MTEKLWVLVFLVSFVLLHYLSYAEVILAVVREDVQPRVKKEQVEHVELLPDDLNLQIKTSDDAIVPLQLTKNNIDHGHSKITFDDSEMNERDLDLRNQVQVVGYYHDKKQRAALSVTARVIGGKIERTLRGTLLRNGKMYEVHPVEDRSTINERSQASKLQKDRTFRAQQLHVLREVNTKFINLDAASTLKKEKETNNIGKKTQDFLMEYRQNMKRIKEQKKEDSNTELMYAESTPEMIPIESTPKTIHVELLFIIDFDTYYNFVINYEDLAVERIVYYYHHILNGMYLAFADIDDEEFQIVLWLKNLHIITKEENAVVDITAYMKELSEKEKKPIYNGQIALENLEDYCYAMSEDTCMVHDITMLFTRLDLHHDSDVLGVGYQCSVCLDYALAISEDRGPLSWHTAAHEAAHVLGAEHDSKGHCGDDPSKPNIMYYQEYKVNQHNLENAFSFSPCTVQDIKTCIAGNSWLENQEERTCLYNQVCEHHMPLYGIDNLPGSMISLDKQCSIYYSDPAATCNSDIAEQICLDMYCELGDGTLKNGVLRAAPGSPCNLNDSNMVCYYGECVNKDSITNSTIDDSLCANQSTSDESVNGRPSNNRPEEEEEEDQFLVKYCRVMKDNEDVPGVLCPGESNYCIPFEWACDGEFVDCYSEVDEEPWFCKLVPPPVPNSVRCMSDPGKYTTVPSYFSVISNCSEEDMDWYQSCPSNCEYDVYGQGKGVNCPEKPVLCVPYVWLCDDIDDCKPPENKPGDETPAFCKMISKYSKREVDSQMHVLPDNSQRKPLKHKKQR